MKNKTDKVEILHRINKLKKKTGVTAASGATGYIPEALIKSAQEIIDEKESDYPPSVKAILEEIEGVWRGVPDLPEESQKAAIEAIYNYANNIKDLTSMYQHDLMHHFSLSLREFCEKIDVGKKPHHIIVRAHLDVMWVTYDEKLRSDETAQAEELKKALQIAIEKHA